MTEQPRLRIEAMRDSITGRFACGVVLDGRVQEVAFLTPERDPRVPVVPDQPDAAQPGYGYTGRLASVGRVIMLAREQRDQIERWQSGHDGDPWPLYGMASSLMANGQVLTIDALNGRWSWQLHPAYFPAMGDSPWGDVEWYVGVGL